MRVKGLSVSQKELLVNVVARTELGSSSLSVARRLLAQNAVYLNGERMSSNKGGETLKYGGYLQVGNVIYLLKFGEPEAIG